MESERAGIPPLQRCMLCHSKIIVDYPPIIYILQTHYSKGEPVEWKKINTFPDHVHFFHGIHIAKGFDCGRCHGDVAAMDRIVLEHKFNMEFCIKCHKDEKATIDCFNCHY
jgi:predicted CXXCH cytochrome family protein